ncbi:hypothetical protein A7D25_12275 [Pseudomonas sp. 21C1]|nr:MULTISPECIES: hypothetical protein [Pseudomonas]OEC34872.1 hypothetical protein A7D25_12275 [Pseudomonas sp. 21C1]
MAITNLDKYKADLDDLIARGRRVHDCLLNQTMPGQFKEIAMSRHIGDSNKANEYIDGLPLFRYVYQQWYSEALALVKQLLPDRLGDFTRLYDKPKTRKSLDFESYRIEDAIQGIQTTRGGQVIADASAAITLLDAQIAIVKSIKQRFTSSLFDIKLLVQADLFDSELEAARELLKHKFTRAAGAIAGVVLEKHLGQVCENHGIKIAKKHPTISDFNEALKAASVIDVAQWRFHQHLGDIRNNCDHSKESEPTQEQVKDLIDGVAKVSKTIF